MPKGGSMVGTTRREKKLFNLLKRKQNTNSKESISNLISVVEQEIDRSEHKFSEDREKIIERREELRKRMKKNGSIR